MGEQRSVDDPSGGDAQRGLEQRALRNVRGLVDRVQAEDDVKRRSQKWVVGVLVAVVALLGAIVATTVLRKPGNTQEIVVSPAAKAPAR